MTIDEMTEEVIQLYEHNIITPDAAASEHNPWIDARRHIPRPKAEAFLQGWLKSILSMAFLNLVARFEMPGTEGRCDLLLVSPSQSAPHSWRYHAALELKVLRSVTSTGRDVSSQVSTRAI